jgi:hypothetical protein
MKRWESLSLMAVCCSNKEIIGLSPRCQINLHEGYLL